MLDASPSGEPSSTRWSDVEFSRQPEAPHSRTAPRWQEFREQHSLGFLIGEHYDADEDGDVDGSDPWYHNVWDERWRLVATYRGADSDPKEQYVLHHAGFDGRGGSSYINDVIVRDRDANTDWDSASDGTLEERLFYLTNWRHDVVALLDSSGYQVEQVRYSAYGVPFGLPAGDADSDGDCDAADITQIDAWISAPAYDGRGDVDVDGDVDAFDKSAISSSLLGASIGRSALSTRGNCIAWMGAQTPLGDSNVIHARSRQFSGVAGRWSTRDPLGYVDGRSLYEYGASMPVASVDPLGLQTVTPGGGGVLSAGNLAKLQNAKKLVLQWSGDEWLLKVGAGVGWLQSPIGKLRIKLKFCEAMMLTLQKFDRGPDCTAGWDGTKMNAVLHCTFACMLTQETNAAFAFYTTTLHETSKINEQCAGGPSHGCWLATINGAMDYHNNNVGIGLGGGDSDCSSACMSSPDLAVLSGSLPNTGDCEPRGGKPWTTGTGGDEETFMNNCMNTKW